jgi:hypothetical protein
MDTVESCNHKKEIRFKRAASPQKRVQVKMLRTLRESSNLDEDPDHELAYFVLARVEQPIHNAKVNIPLDNVF